MEGHKVPQALQRLEQDQKGSLGAATSGRSLSQGQFVASRGVNLRQFANGELTAEAGIRGIVETGHTVLCLGAIGRATPTLYKKSFVL